MSAENYVEAGFTLKLYADMLSWDKESLTFAPQDNAGQPEWQRKEKLYQQVIDYFDKGKCWEKGVPLCKELAFLYETRRFDYVELSKTLRKEALFFENILYQIRPEPEYFRVGFYGRGFPLFVRNKQFIYRGLEYERIGTFTQRLQTEFSQAQILTKNSPPDQTILMSPDQFLQINNVKPISNPIHLRTATVPVPDRISSFYEVNDVTRFQYDRPIHKGTIDKDNEFKTLWIERTILEIETSLPGILRWFEVISRAVKELTPIEFACETMLNVQKELSDLIAQYRANPKLNINPFSMRLQGIIDANVMGGISKYQEAFFTEEFLKSELGKTQAGYVQRLKSLILDQMQILETALELHGQVAPDGVQPLHKRLIERFHQLKQGLIGLGKANTRRQNSESIVNTPLPPLPFEKRTMSLGGTSSQGVYEQEEVYTRPGDCFNYAALGSGNKKRESLALPDIQTTIPPIPVRPKSAGYNCFVTDSPDVPPKTTGNILKHSPGAPPLPPRGYTPDKRLSNPILYGECDQQTAPHLPRRSHKYSVVDISLESSDINLNQTNDSVFLENRDSGFSISTQELNMNQSFEENNITTKGHNKTNSNPEVLQIITQELSQSNGSPPPIPKKSNIAAYPEGNISPVPRPSSGDGYCVPRNGGGIEEQDAQ